MSMVTRMSILLDKGVVFLEDNCSDIAGSALYVSHSIPPSHPSPHSEGPR